MTVGYLVFCMQSVKGVTLCCTVHAAFEKISVTTYFISCLCLKEVAK